MARVLSRASVPGCSRCRRCRPSTLQSRPASASQPPEGKPTLLRILHHSHQGCQTDCDHRRWWNLRPRLSDLGVKLKAPHLLVHAAPDGRQVRIALEADGADRIDNEVFVS